MGTSKGYISPTTIEWSKTKRAVTSLIDKPTKENIKKSVAKFSEAMKKDRVADKIFTKAVAQIINLSRNIKTNGIDNSLKALGRNDLIGKDNEEIFNDLLYYFTDNGASIEDSLAIDALSKALNNLEINDIEKLKDMNEEGFLREVIYEFAELSFEFRFFEKISNKRTPSETRKILNDLKEYIKGTIYEELKIEDINQINFQDLSGEVYIVNLCNQTLKIFEDIYEGDK